MCHAGDMGTSTVVPSMNLVISIVYLAMLRCGYPVFLSELLMAVNQGKVFLFHGTRTDFFFGSHLSVNNQ